MGAPQDGDDRYAFDVTWHAEAGVTIAPAPFLRKLVPAPDEEGGGEVHTWLHES
jgi:hypothetical protein